MKKKIWRKNFELQRAEYVMMSEAIESFYKFQKHAVGRNYLRETIMAFENGDNTATYYPKDELRNYIEAILKEIRERPLKLITLNERAIEYNRQFFQRLKEVEKINFARESERRLLKIFHELFELEQLSHGYSFPTTWFSDCDGEDFSNYLIGLVNAKIKERRLKLSAPEVFTVLTSPDKESLAQKEEKEMFGHLGLIIKDSQASELFKLEDLVKVEAGLKFLKKNLRGKIRTHYKKWRWTPYAYVGPAYDLDYYLSCWSSLIRQKVEPNKEIKKLVAAKSETMARREKLLKDLKLDKREVAIFDLAAQIVWLKAFRKDALFYGMYVIDKILKELARRAGLSFMQIKYIAGFEMKDFRKFSPDELNQRFKFSVMRANRGRIKIYTGQAAKIFLKKQTFEKVVIKDSGELKGTAAYVGRVKGRVKIINLPEDMSKMEKGDIMVSHTTFPSLVPAMKKAAAIVTDDGGITCHAAIVARELKTPCVVGVKIATKVLRDGDYVEVDANRGIVKKIKK